MFLRLLPLQRFQLQQASLVSNFQEQAPETQSIWFWISDSIVKYKELQKITHVTAERELTRLDLVQC
jgi:hypothetical protein